jgi:hypothetical protein
LDCVLKLVKVFLIIVIGKEEKGNITTDLWEKEAGQKIKGESGEDCGCESLSPDLKLVYVCHLICVEYLLD